MIKKLEADVELNLSDVNVQVDDEHTNRIVVDEQRNLEVSFNYPSLEFYH